MLGIILFTIIGIALACFGALFSVMHETSKKLPTEITNDPDYKKYIDLSSKKLNSPEDIIRGQLRYGIRKLFEDDEFMFAMTNNISKYGYYVIEYGEDPETCIFFKNGIMTYHQIEDRYPHNTHFRASYTLKRNREFCVEFLFKDVLFDEFRKHNYEVKEGYGIYRIEASDELKKALDENKVNNYL